MEDDEGLCSCFAVVFCDASALMVPCLALSPTDYSDSEEGEDDDGDEDDDDDDDVDVAAAGAL